MKKTFDKIHHYMGVELNQQTWALLGKKIVIKWIIPE